MLERLRQHIEQQQLFQASDKLLFAISGGLDSMVLLHALHLLGYKGLIAHVNFGLRGDESQRDEDFVRSKAQSYNFPIEVLHAQTAEYAMVNKVSVQMAARNIRYDWFFDLLKREACRYVIVAHHMDDSIETLFINLIRGTGIRGLKGISNSSLLRRPFLPFSRAELLQYAHENGIEWREDSSNASTYYLRNKLRHQVLPNLDAINPTWRTLTAKVTEELQVVNVIIDQWYNREIGPVRESGFFELSMLNTETGKYLLQRYLLELNFHRSAIEQILLLNASVGASYFSSSHEVLVDRERLYIRPCSVDVGESTFEIYDGQESLLVNEQLISIEKIARADIDSLKQKGVYYFDLEKMAFPLLIRKWNEGDWMIPLGMQGRKKLSDFFIDEKFSIHQKEDTFVMLTNGNVAWILGNRIDERYKVTPESKWVLAIKITNGK